MKYKNLKSFSHNFTHSFVSYENYVDGGYIIEELRKFVRELDGEILIIHWIPANISPNKKLSARVFESLDYYRKWLPKLAKQHQVELDSITDFHTEIFRKPNHQIEVLSCLTDDRGKSYKQSVQF